MKTYWIEVFRLAKGLKFKVWRHVPSSGELHPNAIACTKVRAVNRDDAIAQLILAQYKLRNMAQEMFEEIAI